ncbi:hypothetical protein Isop_0549 [Isosphaera pallida ATCC 43644]|uniref:Chromosome partition protein Smc n=1 Tax=Isosphaera pallida (strain ATCC 43644 / DSM 9630 / IS1B) TaxID=575540 RepID=E8R024_ISOPI|nr:hypothetical protein [Isosphaera pallida]ADV61142.1 hypothetical protein Isop_0549 [Isosphaera pallida ATCC 43644]
MEVMEAAVGRVHRRLRVRRFLAVSWVAATICLLLATVVTVGFHLAGRPDWLGPTWLVPSVALGVAAFIAALVTLVSGPSRLDAAVAIDHAFDLNERLSSALALPSDLRDTPAGRAVLADAARRIEHLELTSRFGVLPSRRAWWAAVAGLLAVGAGFLPADLADQLAQAGSDPPKTTPIDPEHLAKTTDDLKKRLAQRREQLDEKQAETAKVLAEIEQGLDRLKKPEAPQSQEQALANLNKLIDVAKQRREQLESVENMARQMERMAALSQEGPAEQLAKDLANGDPEKAAETVKTLVEKLTKPNEMSARDKQALTNQLQEMSKELRKQANLEEKRKQLDEARKSGAISQQEFDREMAKLDRQQANLDQLKTMADQLAQAAEAMRQGDMQKAAQQLQMSQAQLEEMAQALSEIESLDAAMSDLAEAKNGLSNDGANRLGEGLGSFGLGRNSSGRQGDGLGRGQGEGKRPIAPDDTNLYDTTVKQQLTKGKGVIEGLGPRGQSIRGESVLTGVEATEAARIEAIEAITTQKIPASVKKHIQSYFDQLQGQP